MRPTAHFPFPCPWCAVSSRYNSKTPSPSSPAKTARENQRFEASAASANLPTAGGFDVESDESLGAARKLGEWLRLSWAKRTRRGFFLRAEDFFRFQHRVNATQHELGDLAAKYEAEIAENPREEGNIRRAQGYILSQQRELRDRYGENADARSHGEAFLHFFEERLVPGGLYLLDEPEAPLSPLRQLAFLSLLKRFVALDCQFLIVTHSPILMAFPEAVLLDFNVAPPRKVGYDQIESVALMRAFLNAPDAYLRRL